MDSEVKSEVFNMDCLEYMKTLPDNCFDLCIADPPYGIDAANMNMGSGKKHWHKKDWDKNIPIDMIFEQIFRISKNNIIWGGVITLICHRPTLGLFGIKVTMERCLFLMVSWHGPILT